MGFLFQTMDKKGFLLYATQWAALQQMNDSELGGAIRELCGYAFDGITPERPSVAFMFLKAQIDIDGQKYQEKCEKNRANISKRWNTEDTTEYDRIRPNTKRTNKEDKENKDEDKDKEENKDNDKKKNTPNGVSKEKTTTRFIKPTIEEIAAYCQEKGYYVDAEYFFNYYEGNGWKVGRNAMKNWKATLATWNTKEKEHKQDRDYELQRRQWETRRHEGAVSDFEHLTPEDEQF